MFGDCVCLVCRVAVLRINSVGGYCFFGTWCWLMLDYICCGGLVHTSFGSFVTVVCLGCCLFVLTGGWLLWL